MRQGLRAYCATELFPSAQLLPRSSAVIISNSNNILLLQSCQSHTRSTAASSFDFQLIINNALEVYHKRTKNDLLLHPLAAQLQTCESPTDVLAVLRQQVQGLDQSRSGDDRWTKWLDPTINVLLASQDSWNSRPGMPNDAFILEQDCTRLGSLLTSSVTQPHSVPRSLSATAACYVLELGSCMAIVDQGHAHAWYDTSAMAPTMS